jgi:hypothetical protein
MRLGDANVLAAEIIARPELKSWAPRWPWVAYCLIPASVFVAGFVGSVLLLGLSLQVDRHTVADGRTPIGLDEARSPKTKLDVSGLTACAALC